MTANEQRKETHSEKTKGGEKPLSLAPLKLKEALANLLAVKPKPKEEELEAKKEEPEE